MENIKHRPLYKYSKRYGSLVSSFFSYYIFIPFLVPFLFMKNKIQINSLILHFEFIPIFILLYILLISVSLLLLPFCYIKIIRHKIHLINREYKSRCVGLMYLLIYVIFGLFINIIQTLFIDTINFSKHIYSKELPLLYSSESLEVFSPNKINTFKQFLSKFDSDMETEHVSIDISEFENELRENCGIKKELGIDYSYVLKLMKLRAIDIFLFEQFARRNIIQNMVQPAMLFEVIDSCSKFKTLKNIILKRKMDNTWEKIYDIDSKLVIQSSKRENWVLHYLKVTQILKLLKKEEKVENLIKDLTRAITDCKEFTSNE